MFDGLSGAYSLEEAYGRPTSDRHVDLQVGLLCLIKLAAATTVYKYSP